MRDKVAISWSGGKDCTLALFEILKSNQFDVINLHTSFNIDTKRVGLHGIKQELIERQAKSIGIGLDKILVPTAEDHVAYENAMHAYFQNLSKTGITKVVFGDIFLEDLKVYREKMLFRHGLEGLFPLWKSDSRTVAEKFINLGFKAIVCAADAKYFTKEHVGQNYSLDFLHSLHPEVDPCGENGEFHTFAYDGPIFKEAVSVEQHQIETKEYSYKVNLPSGQSESRVSRFWFRELN